MRQRKTVNFALLSMGADALCAALALGAATILRPALSALPFAAWIPWPLTTPWLLFPLFSGIWVGILMIMGTYDPAKRTRLIDEVTHLTIGSLLAAMALAGLLYLSFRDVSRLLFINFALLTFVGMLAWRLIYRASRTARQQAAALNRRVLVIGSEQAAAQITQEFLEMREQTLEVIGRLWDDANPSSLGTIQQARAVVQSQSIDDIVIALPVIEYSQLSLLLRELDDLPVSIWMIPAYYHLAVQNAMVEEYAGIPMLDLTAPTLSEYQRVIKRAFDLAVTVLLMIPSLPIMAFVALAMRITDRGPVILHQQRMGENGRLFEMFKFRSMVPEADQQPLQAVSETEDGQPVFKSSADPRITRLGRVLRRTSLDEMPQLFNVLRGEMSLVGPRPELPHLLDQYEPWQRKRFSVPQGLTGWWQVNGRSDKPMHLNSEYDLYYIQHHSLLLDVYILIKTVVAVVQGRGAF